MRRSKKNEYDKKFYLSLDKEIKEVINYQTFLELERLENEELIYYINKIAEITYLEGNNFEKTLHFIFLLDLDIDKISDILKETNYIQIDDIKHLEEFEYLIK